MKSSGCWAKNVASTSWSGGKSAGTCLLRPAGRSDTCAACLSASGATEADFQSWVHGRVWRMASPTTVQHPGAFELVGNPAAISQHEQGFCVSSNKHVRGSRRLQPALGRGLKHVLMLLSLHARPSCNMVVFPIHCGLCMSPDLLQATILRPGAVTLSARPLVRHGSPSASARLHAQRTLVPFLDRRAARREPDAACAAICGLNLGARNSRLRPGPPSGPP